MKSLLSFMLIGLFAFLLAACGNEKGNESLQETDNSSELPDDSGLPTHSQLADSMAITEATLGKVKSENEQLIDTQLNDKEIILTFQLRSDETVEDLKPLVDKVLMEISEHTVDSNELPDGYATVYDFYDVSIKVVNSSNEVKAEGKLEADQDQVIIWS